MQGLIELTFSFAYGLFKYRIRPCFIQKHVKTLGKLQCLARIKVVFADGVISNCHSLYKISLIPWIMNLSNQILY